jgi:hypothetical protein
MCRRLARADGAVELTSLAALAELPLRSHRPGPGRRGHGGNVDRGGADLFLGNSCMDRVWRWQACHTLAHHDCDTQSLFGTISDNRRSEPIDRQRNSNSLGSNEEYTL